MASLANSSVARGCGEPLGRMVSLSTLVRSNTLAMSALPSSRSSRPGLGGRPSMRRMEGRATSASTSITVWSSSEAMLIARFTDVKLLPSPGKALVTMIRLPCATVAAPLPMALAISGRLMTRYWSAMCDRGEIGVTMPAVPSMARSISTCRDCGKGSAYSTCTGAAGSANLGVTAGSWCCAKEAGRSGSGMEMPAWRSCSRRSAACSIRLLIALNPVTAAQGHRDQTRDEKAYQPARGRHETHQAGALVASVGVGGQRGDDAEQRQTGHLAQLVGV